jgi:hypothetical protein
LAQPKRCPKN